MVPVGKLKRKKWDNLLANKKIEKYFTHGQASASDNMIVSGSFVQSLIILLLHINSLIMV